MSPVASEKPKKPIRKNKDRAQLYRIQSECTFYEMIAPDANKIKEITINVLNRSDKDCFRKEKHNKNMIYVDETDSKDLVPKNGNSINNYFFRQQSKYELFYSLLS